MPNFEADYKTVKDPNALQNTNIRQPRFRTNRIDPNTFQTREVYMLSKFLMHHIVFMTSLSKVSATSVLSLHHITCKRYYSNLDGMLIFSQ